MPPKHARNWDGSKSSRSKRRSNGPSSGTGGGTKARTWLTSQRIRLNSTRNCAADEALAGNAITDALESIRSVGSYAEARIGEQIVQSERDAPQVIGPVIKAHCHFRPMTRNGLTAAFQSIGLTALDIELYVSGSDPVECLV